jgi:SAM-dependent methyltransferase
MSAYLANLEQAVAQFTGHSFSGQDEDGAFLDLAAVFYELTRHIHAAIPHHNRPAIMEVLCPARQRLAEAPLFRRCQTWPRGFPGDYETIEMMLGEDHTSPQSSQSSFVRCAETFFRRSTPVQQHRNKIAHQAIHVVETWSHYGADARILIIAAGGCLDVRMALPTITLRPPHMTLVDFDPAALDFARRQLVPIEASCRFVRANAARSLDALGDERFHLVMAGGLFDYLPDQVIVALLSRLYRRHLLPGGRVFFTNFSDYNPYRAWMYYLLNWTLIERSNNQLMDLCTKAGIEAGSVRIYKEATGLTYLVEATA